MAKRASSNRSLTRQLASTVRSANSAIAAAGARGQDTSGAQNAVNRSNSMLAQTKSQGSRSYKGSSFEKEYNATPLITADKVSPMPELKLPTPTAPTAVADADVTNASLAGFGSMIESNKFVPDPSLSDRSNAVAEADFTGRQGLKEYIDSIRPKEGQNENALISARKQSGFTDAQEEVNRYQNQINVITGKRDAEILGLDGQGRGISETIIGGQQARISRDAAIMAMPLQAQLAAAQGNLEVAATLMGQLFTAKSADIAQNAQFLQNVGNALLNYSNTQQANLLNAKMADISERAAKEQADLSFLRQNVDSAIKSGATAAEVGNLSSDTMTTAQKVALAQSITARGASEMRGLDIAGKRANIAQSNASIRSSNASAALNEKALRDQNKAVEAGILTPKQGELATELRKERNTLQEVKDVKDLEGSFVGLISALAQENGVGDISAINSFQRLAVDPGVAVREGDVALLQSAQSFKDQATLRARGLMVGAKLTPEAREQMKTLSAKIYDARVAFVEENTSQIRTVAEENGIDYNKYIGKSFVDSASLIANIGKVKIQTVTPTEDGITLEDGASYTLPN